MTNERPLLLLSNDDGVNAKGIQELIAALRTVADLIVIAPDGRVRVHREPLLPSIRFAVQRCVRSRDSLYISVREVLSTVSNLLCTLWFPVSPIW